VTIGAGQTLATFPVATHPVAANTPVVISASLLGATDTVALTVKAPSVSALALTPGNVVGGAPVQGTVTISGAAAAGGVIVALSSADTGLASVPGTVTVPEGSTTAAFTIATSPVTANIGVGISAAANGQARSATLTLLPLLSSVTLSATSVTGGAGVVGTVRLNAGAPPGGSPVALSSDNPAAGVPASVTVPAGSASATFPVATFPVTTTTSDVIGAALGGTARTAVLTVRRRSSPSCR
jgi:hypothetical protein